MPDLLAGFALVAVVLTIAGLTSGFVERAPLSFPIIFLGLGFLLGTGLGLLHFGPESALLETVATLTLAMVLCLEAVRIGNIGMGGAGFVPILSLGPGTVVIVAVIAAGSYLLLGCLGDRGVAPRHHPGLHGPRGVARRGQRRAHPAPPSGRP